MIPYHTMPIMGSYGSQIKMKWRHFILHVHFQVHHHCTSTGEEWCYEKEDKRAVLNTYAHETIFERGTVLCFVLCM